jgi:chorismate-pyruvate lyase
MAGRSAETRASDLVRLFAAPGRGSGSGAGAGVEIAVDRPLTASVRSVSVAELPQPARELLAHARHMTDAQERYHGCQVELRILGVLMEGTSYAREILLVRPDGRVVQYGIVRIDLAAVDAATAARIRAAETPLGRILAEAGIFCAVDGVQCIEFVPPERLVPHLGPDRLFGRVADIRVADRPAIELLEVVVI